MKHGRTKAQRKQTEAEALRASRTLDAHRLPEAVNGRPEKHSLTLRGHRTSVSLETAFWDAFREIAAREGKGLNQLATEIDAERGDVGLASAIRVHILRHYRG